MLRNFSPLKIRRLRPGLNPQTWVPKASTLPLDHRRRFRSWYCFSIQDILLMVISLFVKCRHSTPLRKFNPLNAELNPICYLLALLGAHHFLHISRIRVKLLTLRLLMSYIYICMYVYIYIYIHIYIYIYGAPILGVSKSHTTTHHSW